ncbi:MAG: hypothetical protein HOM80_07050 [Bacteroidetes bacterium]|nr:hypothetical protein [Bacteroidota bacterium]
MKLFLNLLFTAVAIALSIWLFVIIREPIKLKAENKIKKDAITKRLEDVRTAQFAYKDSKGKYAKDWDTLIYVCKFDSIQIIKTIGDPDDTTKVTRYDTLYERIATQFPVNFAFDSLRIIPYTSGAFFELDAGVINQRGVDVHVFQVSDSKPFDPEHPLILGDMTEVNTSGNWK